MALLKIFHKKGHSLAIPYCKIQIHYFCCVNTFFSHVIFYITDKKDDKSIAIAYYHNFEKEPIWIMANRKNIITLLQNTSGQFHKGTTATLNQPRAIKRCGGMRPPALHLASRRAVGLVPSK